MTLMEPVLHSEPNHVPSDFLTFSTSQDMFFQSESATPPLTYLRIELARIRTGMSDFLIRIASPKYKAGEKNTLITLRGTKGQAKYDGALATARVIIREMKSRKDATHAWDNADEDHLARLLMMPLKTFALNPTMELLRFSTEALK